MSTPTHDVTQARVYALGQIHDPSQSWAGLCQSFVRHCHGVPSWALTAYDAWLRIPAQHRHSGDAPLGAAVYFERNHAGAERPGHVVFSLGDGMCVSNDIYRHGMVDKAPISVFAPHWNMRMLGWSFWTPYGYMPKAAS